jgi:hypothetical protein
VQNPKGRVYPGERVKVGRLGEFMISARAIPQGTRWAGIFRITRPNQDWTVTLPFQEEEHLELTYGSRESAIEAAFSYAEDLIRSRERTGKA